MAIHYTNPKELQGEQADILWEPLTLNPNLMRRPSLTVNQQLNTKNARIISAINEIKIQADTATASVVEAMNYVNTVVGDAGDPDIQAKLQELGGNVIEAIYNLKDKVNIEVTDGGTF